MATDECSPAQDGSPRHEWDPPSWVRLPLLEVALGCAPEDITWDTLEAITARRVSENACLDFKGGLYGPGKAMDEFSKDVAAFANASGGLLVLGIREDGQARAKSLHPAPITDSERRRMVEASTRIAPMVADISIGEIRNPADPEEGAYLILVPASPQAPHAIEREHRMQWPVREDRKTRWMSEPEIASRYRSRFQHAQNQDDRLLSVMHEGCTALQDGRDATWLCLALSPALTSRQRIDREQVRRWIEEGLREVPWRSLVQSKNLSIGRRRVILSNESPFHGNSSDIHFELHSNGSGFAAIAMHSEPPAEEQRRSLPLATAYINVENVAVWSTALLDILVRHAANTSASGDYVISAQLLPGKYPGAPDDSRPASMVEPFKINGSYFGGSRIVPGSRPVIDPSPTYTTTTPALTRSPQDLLQAAHDLFTDLIGEFGATPSDPIINADGTIAPSALASPYLSTFADWAQRAGLVS